MFLKNLGYGILQYYYNGITITRSQEIILTCILAIPFFIVLVDTIVYQKD